MQPARVEGMRLTCRERAYRKQTRVLINSFVSLNQALSESHSSYASQQISFRLLVVLNSVNCFSVTCNQNESTFKCLPLPPRW